MYPEYDVACKGANFTYMITCPPGESVCGRVIPLILKSFATRLTLLNETFSLPVFVMVTATVLLVPSNHVAKTNVRWAERKRTRRPCWDCHCSRVAQQQGGDQEHVRKPSSFGPDAFFQRSNRFRRRSSCRG